MQLSDFELDVLNLIWKRGECTAPQIHEAILESRDVTYSTVKTIIDRLEEKGAVERAGQVGRTIVLKAAIEPDATRRSLLRRFVNRVFAGDRTPLLNQLFAERKLSSQEAAYLETLLAEHRQDD